MAVRGSPRFSCRLPADTLEQLDRFIAEVNETRRGEKYSRSTFVIAAIIEKLDHYARSKKARRGASPVEACSTCGHDPCDCFREKLADPESFIQKGRPRKRKPAAFELPLTEQPIAAGLGQGDDDNDVVDLVNGPPARLTEQPIAAGLGQGDDDNDVVDLVNGPPPALKTSPSVQQRLQEYAAEQAADSIVSDTLSSPQTKGESDAA